MANILINPNEAPIMRFKGLDLNLLVIFDVLMRHHSVSRAAEQLHLSQPAISAALKRLRDYFGDDILVVTGRRMFPTSFAESMWPQIRQSLEIIGSVVSTSTKFDATTSQRTFRMCGSDYMATAVFAPLARRLSQEAPTVVLDLTLSSDQSEQQLEHAQVDLLISPEGYTVRDMPAEHLLDERHVVVGCASNPIFSRPLDEDAFMSARHVQVAIGAFRTLAFGDREIEMQGRRRRIDVIASSFAIVPWLLIDTPRLALMHERLARVMAQHQPLAIAPVPFDFPVMREMIQFHPARASDPGLVWLRGELQKQVTLN
jgi:LysR family nod box-dependent transcriptional activator